MTRRKVGQEKIRSIQKTRDTYTVSIPIELMHKLGWQHHQRVVVELSGRSKLTITDYKS
ncbi:MAG: hypothetical protein ABI220_00125 [Candidatus Saccharimonadales bacterium]